MVLGNMNGGVEFTFSCEGECFQRLEERLGQHPVERWFVTVTATGPDGTSELAPSIELHHRP